MRDLSELLNPAVPEKLFGDIRDKTSGAVGRLLREYREKDIKCYNFKAIGISPDFVILVENGDEEIRDKKMLMKIMDREQFNNRQKRSILKAFEAETYSQIKDEDIFTPNGNGFNDKAYEKPERLDLVFINWPEKFLSDIYNPVILFHGWTPTILNEMFLGFYQGIWHVLAGVRAPNAKSTKLINKKMGLSSWDEQILIIRYNTAAHLKKIRKK